MTVVSQSKRGRRLLPAAAFFVLVLGQSSALAQRVEPPRPLSGTGGAAGVGGGAGHAPTMPDFRPVPVAPVAPTVAPSAPVTPAAPVPIIRFRCQVAPGADTCKEQPPPDGGGDETCDCARDFCYADPAGARICEKP